MASLNSHTQSKYTDSGPGPGLDDVTAKHSFFKNPDLMAITFSHLKNEKRRCLLNVALTCKDFLDVALDALWEELFSLVPLLKLLPALQFEDGAYVCANVHVFSYVLILSFVFRSLVGCVRIGILLSESQVFQTSTRMTSVIPRFTGILRLIFELGH
jgi:hypothetical protein